MSVITGLSVYSHCNDLGGKVWNPAIRWSKKYAVFIVLQNDQGITGLGECWCFDTAPDTLVAYIRTEVAPHVIGINVDDFSTIAQSLVSRATLTARHGILASAWAGVDIALWDMRSRAAHLPLWTFLQSQLNTKQSAHGQVALYASGGLYGEDKRVDDLVVEMVGMAQRGFQIVKMKIGGLSIAEDVQRVMAVLDGLGDKHKLIIDGVYSYDSEQAIELYSALPSERIEAFQSPVKACDIAGMQALTDIGVPVMGTEAEYREELHLQLIEQRAVKYLQTAPVACGGLSRLINLTKLIDQSGNDTIKISLEVSSTAIALMAACHFAAASSHIAHTEYHFLHTVFFDDLLLAPVAKQPGIFQMPDEIGLGISLPQSAVKLEFQYTNTNVLSC